MAVSGNSTEIRQVYVLSSNSDKTNPLLTIDCPTGSAMTNGKVSVQGGSKYYISVESDCQIYGINLIKDTTVRTNTTWTFRTDTEDGTAVNVEGTSTILFDGKLTVDATTGKFVSRAEQWAQFNTGAKLTFKVAKGATVTIKGYTTGYTVNGTAATAKDTTITASEDMTVEIVSTSDASYLDSIVVTYAA